jgi:hypothetical protein
MPLNAKKKLYVATGCLMVLLGALGILLPFLPTTPFLLLAAYLFARSNDKLYGWLLGHKHLGPYIHAFRNKTGLTRAQKLRLGSSFTVVMLVSFYFAPVMTWRYVLAAMWLFWTVMLLRVRTTARGPRAI